MKDGARQIVRAATGSARSHARNVRHWASGRQAASATRPGGRLSPASREWLWHLSYFLGRAKKHGLPGAVFASLLVGTTIAVELLVLHGEKGDDQTRGAAITVLGTVVTFFAVSTLAVSVSLTLLQTAAHMWPARIMDSIFTEDPDRKFLLQTICAAFLVSLVNLALLTAGLVHPLLALVWPVLLAFLTLMLMVAYVFERVRLFSSTGLIDEIARRCNHQIDLLDDDHSEAPQEAGLQALAMVSDIFEVALALVDDKRKEDAEQAIWKGFQLMEWLLEKPAAAGLQDRLPSGPGRIGWQDRLSIALYRADSAFARADAINGDSSDSYYFAVENMLQQLSGITLVNLGWAHLSHRETRREEARLRTAQEISTFGVLARALLKNSQNTDADDNSTTPELLKSVALSVRQVAKDLSRLDDGAPGDYGGPVDAIGFVRECFSPAVLALPEFSRLSSWLAKMEASLSAKQSAMLKKHWAPIILRRWEFEAEGTA